MAIKNTLLGGTDYTGGVNTNFSGDMNDTNDALVTKKIYTDIIDSNTPATTSSYTTMFESDISSDSDLFAYNFRYKIYFTASVAGGQIQLKITFDDTSTDTVEIVTSISASSKNIRVGSYSNTKKIDKVEIQGKTTGSGVNVIYDLSVDGGDGYGPYLGDITYF